MMAESEMIRERAERSCRMPREELRSKVRGQEVSVAHEENAGYTLFRAPIGRSIMSAKGQRKIRNGGMVADLCVVNHNATLSRRRQKQQQ
jgi:hypothetical protein